QGGLSFIAGALPGTVPSMMEPETSASDTKQPQIEQQTEWQPAGDIYNPQAQHFGQWLQLQTVQPIGPDTDSQHWQTHAAYGEHLIGSRTFPALHGGATAAFLIQSALELAHSMGYPVLANFAIDYLRSGKPEPVKLTLTTLHRSRRAWTVSVRLLQQEQKRLVAQAQLHFTCSL
ncbi:MAG: PaaI family thioesterase, partial [Gammaproteobacteria bacterium]